MSLTPMFAQAIAHSSAFEEAMANLNRALNAATPAFARFLQVAAEQHAKDRASAARHRSRVVTRSKQRRYW